MRRRPDGMLEAETFEEHMAPDVEWIEDPEFARAFDALLDENEHIDYDTANLQFGVPVAHPLRTSGVSVGGVEDPCRDTRVHGTKEEPMPAHTNEGSNFPGFINVRFDEGKAILTVRGDPKRIDADTDSTEYWKASPTVELTLDQGDWDQLIAEAVRERGLVPGG